MMSGKGSLWRVILGGMSLFTQRDGQDGIDNTFKPGDIIVLLDDAPTELWLDESTPQERLRVFSKGQSGYMSAVWFSVCCSTFLMRLTK